MCRRPRKARQSLNESGQGCLHRIANDPVRQHDGFAMAGLGMQKMTDRGSHHRKGLNRRASWSNTGACVCICCCTGPGSHACDPHTTVQLCSGCGVKVLQIPSDRWHSYPHCRLLDQDHNAALNITYWARPDMAGGTAMTIRGTARRKSRLFSGQSCMPDCAVRYTMPNDCAGCQELPACAPCPLCLPVPGCVPWSVPIPFWWK